jgi:hypothetical protein
VRSGWRALPRSRRLWLMSGLIWLPAVLLIIILGPVFGHTRHWTAVYLSIAVIAFVIGMIFWALGTIRLVQEARARRAGSVNQMR